MPDGQKEVVGGGGRVEELVLDTSAEMRRVPEWKEERMGLLFRED